MRLATSWKRIAAVVAAVVVGATAAIAAGTPAQAVATCPDNHVCFFKDWRYENGLYYAAGSMADESSWLIDNPRRIIVPTPAHGAGLREIDTDGAISNFENSVYFDGSGLNDSISLVVNNSNHCLYLLGDKGWQTPLGHPKEAIEFGPHTGRALAGANLGDSNDRLSSAFTVPPGHEFCIAGENSYRMLN